MFPFRLELAFDVSHINGNHFCPIIVFFKKITFFLLYCCLKIATLLAFPLFTSRGALHLQPCCWLLSVLPCWLGKPSGPLLPPGQDKDPQENSSSGCYFTGFPARALWPLRRSQPVVFGGASAGGVAGILGACFNYYRAEKDMLGLSFLSNWGSGIEGLKLGRRA